MKRSEAIARLNKDRTDEIEEDITLSSSQRIINGTAVRMKCGVFVLRWDGNTTSWPMNFHSISPSSGCA